MNLTKAKVSVAILAVCSYGAVANAATVSQCGPNICYEYDDSQLAVTEFGLPTLSGDTLVFLSPMFRAQSDDGAGYVEVSADFVIDSVYSITGEAIQVVSLTEFFDYDVINGDQVTAALDLIIEDNSSFETGNDFSSFIVTGDTGGQQAMQLDGSFNPDNAFAGPANDLKVTISDTLSAETDAVGETAWIQKKVTLATTIVPVPAAVWLFLSGLGFLVGVSRRSRS